MGLDATGLSIPTQTEIKEAIEADLFRDLDPELDVTPASPVGQLIQPVARQLRLAYEALLDLYSSEDPDAAEGTQLERIGAYTDSTRQAATKSRLAGARRATVVFSGAGTIPALNRFSDSAGVIWRAAETLTVASAGTYSIALEADQAGPIPANPNTITVIVDAAANLTSITNPEAAVLGSLQWSDAIFRVQRKFQLNEIGSGNVDGLRTALLDYTDDSGNKPITECIVYENVSDYTDSRGLAAHSVLCVVHDGGLADNNAIAQVIFDEAGTTTTSGAVTGSVLTSGGQTLNRKFSRAATVDLEVQAVLIADPSSFAGEDAAKTALAEYQALVSRIGGRVYFGAYVAELQNVQGVVGVQSVLIRKSTGAWPSVSTDLELGALERAELATTDISITVLAS